MDTRISRSHQARRTSGDEELARDPTDQSPEPDPRRHAYSKPSFDSRFQEIPKGERDAVSAVKRVISQRLDCENAKKAFFGFLPILTWLPKYNLRTDLLADALAGITLAIFHVPQSFGYSLIVGVPPVRGLFTAMFPMMMYVLFGSSRHNSIGAFAVVCIMTSQAMLKAHSELQVPEEALADVASAIAFVAGVFSLVCGLFKLGGLSVFLSDQFVSGFTAGVSVHIGTSQLGGLFGFRLAHQSGVFGLVKAYIEFFGRFLHETHLPTLAFSAVSIAIILLAKIVCDPVMMRKIHMPFPIEMIMVVLSIVVSKQLNLHERGFQVIEHIPNNLPTPKLPPIDVPLLQSVLVDALIIAVVSLTIDVSLGRIWAREKGYQISANQEFFALGFANIFGSFFGAFPVGASVPRSSLVFSCGGRSQMVSVFNVILIGVTIVALGPLLEQIPTAILSSIIVVSLKKIFMQIRDFQNFWAISRIDAHVWLVTFLATVFLNVQLGLICGVIFSLLTLVFKVQTPKTFLLGSIPNTDFYVPIKQYGQATEIPGVKIFHFGGPLHFANAEFFRSELARRTGFDKRIPTNPVADASKLGHSNGSCDVVWRPAEQSQVHTIILDFNRVTFIDGTSAQALRQVAEIFEQLGITLFVAGCGPAVYSLLRKAGVTRTIPERNFFPQIHDAVVYRARRAESSQATESM